ncbi:MULTISPECIES: hypothetical protein [Methylobacterium]|uniref:Uncharacterized protein n=1 Tax=Methylobacterium jeotgali TaxID=381630 RepID=A0ABQ4SZD3_9HYPH|nr:MULTISPECIES: hypothetical protein [Methylobacterium]PIU06850.1 MAG: hypothetical protein COT56_07720 [Methylobacterium sp. CG09_land_8_20_14_0_10_71_15]PIU15719.1 MAG: hypothetical protein COT28_03745 [Methylobacterium sp. CG08_land_8_20_14_0_20_71_15]GBU17215.1 hypothetical protein AwMethylo_14300 [Methylobacterium sp.]GJE07870.1 hypothetical protein AOPFMNJM_3202 [Methylobacterium jeotgali]
MAVPTWPASLPQIPLVPGGSSTPWQAPTETEMEEGPARARRSSTSTWTTIAYAYVMTAAQFATFEAFVRDTLGHGAGRFMIPRWRPGATTPLPLKLARIPGGLPSWRPSGPNVIVTVPLAILDF